MNTRTTPESVPERLPVDPSVHGQIQARIAEFGQAASGLQRRSRRFASLRLLTFILAASGLAWGLWNPDHPDPWLLAAAGLALLAYAGLMWRHDRVIRQEARLRSLVTINRQTLARLERAWRDLPSLGMPERFVQDPTVRDLDLWAERTDQASLVRLLGSVRTPAGIQCLADWLLASPDPPLIATRQEAVTELADDLEFRQELERLALSVTERPHDAQPLVAWAEASPVPVVSPAGRWAARLLPPVTIGLMVLNATGVTGPLWLLSAVGNLLFSAFAGRRLRAMFAAVEWRERQCEGYAVLFEWLAGQTFTSPCLADLRRELVADGRSAARQMRRLQRILSAAELRYSSMMHLPIEAVLLWDFHVADRLQAWRTDAGPGVRRWFSALGELEVLAALAGLKRDHPAWCLPTVNADQPALVAQGLGHPLLHPDTCVLNDVRIGPAGSFLLVTGSNMSGKSTLLRSIGINALLARMGGPVCARSFAMPPVRLGTSFRIQDDLEAGVSYFLAELKRLKHIVERARRIGQAGETGLLFLLDEILQGTNVVERQIAVRSVIQHLLVHGAIGAVSTHDLSLAEAEGLKQVCQPVYFTESYEAGPTGSRMWFDYRLHPGVAPTANALKLLELVGLGKGVLH